jgi:glycosyltransferase involved in cell wall biosynthesis
MTIVFFWTGVTAAMLPCWRALAQQPGVRLVLFVEVSRRSDTAFDTATVFAGLECRVRYEDEPLDAAAIDAEIAALAPEVAVILGWRSPMCRAAAEGNALAAVPKIFAFDMPFAWTLRKLVAPLVLRRYLRRFELAFVPGEWSAVYARHLGFSESRIERGLLGLDTAALSKAAGVRSLLPEHPRQFLFIGRYVADKRIDLLVAGYRRYRSRATEPWGLTCCGVGPDAGRLAGVEGIDDRGFVQPEQLREMFAIHGALVLASDYDPWPVVIAEAVAAGLPVVCTAACGSSVEFVRSYFNGRVVGPGNESALAEALEWVHGQGDEARWIGERGMPLAAPYAKEVWAERVLAICSRVCRQRLPRAGRS